MNRSYKIKPIHATMRLDRWIKNNIGKYPQSLLEKSIRKGKIKLNKKKTNSSYKLKIGDEVSFYNFNYEFKKVKSIKYTPSKKNLDENEKSLIEDNDEFIVINKKAGVSVQGGTKSRNNLIDIFSNSNLFKDTKPYSVHRLDKETSGVMIIAKNYNSAKLLTSLFRLRKVHKTYLAICHGIFKNKKGEIRGNLIKYEKEKKISELAITNYNVISSNNFFSFLELKPVTGRKHQLRKQLSFMGNPIVGDVKYNNIKSKNKDQKKLMLHSYKIKFLINNKKFNFQAKLPDYFNNYLNKKRLII
ncbi:RluA family pseudouridine synthase [Candidatus Pelagibacter communis]|uniref:RluA family pseudouridine synthase n=1 Tax=Pelagibacter ubique TaxID=198252 RepID=UPI00094D72BA|nr:RNA pseudouridine synthase [Candidatus Pelagibacter ubique]